MIWLLLFFAAPAANHTVTSHPVVVTSTFQTDATSYVVGPDGVVRRCPNEKGVAPFIRSEGKGAQNVFVYLPPGQKVFSSPQQPWTLACLEVK